MPKLTMSETSKNSVKETKNKFKTNTVIYPIADCKDRSRIQLSEYNKEYHTMKSLNMRNKTFTQRSSLKNLELENAIRKSEINEMNFDSIEDFGNNQSFTRRTITCSNKNK